MRRAGEKEEESADDGGEGANERRRKEFHFFGFVFFGKDTILLKQNMMEKIEICEMIKRIFFF
jgi:hypothetical protein